MQINEKNILLFYKYIFERYSIYKRKELFKKSPPWTDDLILKNYKFTNVFREDDAGTKYFIENIGLNVNNLGDLIFNAIIYRLYNKIDTFKAIGVQTYTKFNRIDFEKKLRVYKSKGNKVFTDAFIVSGYSFLQDEGDKISRTTKIIEMISCEIKDIVNILESTKESKKTFEEILKLPGIGNFLAYQISVDIGYFRRDIFDENSYVVAGPGCKRGLLKIFDNIGDKSYEDLIFYLEDNQEKYFKKLSIDVNKLFEDREVNKLNIMAIENCLCEFSKYMKAYLGDGRPRNKYKY